MTTTQENARPVPLIGPAVGQAQASLTRLLTGILAESGTSHQVRPDAGRDHQAGPGDDHDGGKPMTTQKLPGADAARHGAGGADLAIMLAAHRAFRRDLARLARTAAAADLSDPARRQSVAAGWELFKHELHLHHTAEDEIIWPALRPRLAHSEHALSVLDEMEEEHERIDPLLAAVDAAFQGGSGGI
jgi:hypothetical protein